MADDEVYPLNLLNEELKSDDTEVRIKAMRKVKIVAQALGCERTRTELIPFLNESTEDEDEILVTLSEELGGFVPLVGGPSHATCLLEPLEALAAAEETVVRDKAVGSINTIVECLSDATETMVPLLKRLAEGDWFTSRVSACALFATAYTRVAAPSHRKELREMYITLCNDDTPMVRRAAASNLGKFASNMEKEYVTSEILPLFMKLSNDDQDSVRLLAIENCSKLGALLEETENKTHILPIVRSSIDDRSWRVRFSIAKFYAPISRAMGRNITKNELLPSFVQLLQDAEAEVRAAAAKNVAEYADIIGLDDFCKEVMDTVTKLARDVAPNVRQAVSIATMELAPKFGQRLIQDELVPLYLIFLNDSVVDVRLNVLNRLHLIAEWAPDMETTVLPALMELSRDLQWRVRKAVVCAFPKLGEHVGAVYFKAHFLKIYLGAFTDLVGDVRASATASLSGLLTSLGSDFILENIVPAVLKVYDTSQIYQERVNTIHALRELSVDSASSDLLAAVTTGAIKAARDKIPNVRATAALVLGLLLKNVDDGMVPPIKDCLSELQKDGDSDVRFNSQLSVETDR